MKTKYLIRILTLLMCTVTVNAQQGINYKAIINNAECNALVNTAVTIQFTILENGTTNVYHETHSTTTDANGIVIVNIGEGTSPIGDFSTIDWGSNPHYLNTQINTGSGLTDMGTTEFKTVPYALHAKTANIALQNNYIAGDGIEIINNVISTTNTSTGGECSLCEALLAVLVNTDDYALLINSGIPLSNLLSAGASVSGLMEAGVILPDLITAGVSISDLMLAGVSVSDLLVTGVSIADFAAIGMSISDLIAAGASLSDFAAQGVTILNLLDAGATVSELLYAGATTVDFAAIGMGLTELLNQGASVSVLLAAGASITDFEAINMSISEMFVAGAQYHDFIGLEYAGGLIFDISSDGSGFVASFNIEDAYEWGCYGTDISGATYFYEANLGYDNTMAIIDACQEDEIAAKVCVDYDDGTYNDWFLPCWKQMELLIINLSSRGLETTVDFDFYWSSSQLNEELAVGFFLPVDPGNLGSLAPEVLTKDQRLRVIPVRAFQQNL